MQRRGFSLIELLVVIAIIGILSAIVMASLSASRARGRDARRQADIKQLQLALELYYDGQDPHTYPIALSSLVAPGYIPAVPKDPRSGLDYAYVALGGASSVICASYHLGAKLETADTGASGVPYRDDSDSSVGGVYGTTPPLQDGPVCAGSAWAGNADIAAVSSDFDGADSSRIYDFRR